MTNARDIKLQHIHFCSYDSLCSLKRWLVSTRRATAARTYGHGDGDEGTEWECTTTKMKLEYPTNIQQLPIQWEENMWLILSSCEIWILARCVYRARIILFVVPPQSIPCEYLRWNTIPNKSNETHEWSEGNFSTPDDCLSDALLISR